MVSYDFELRYPGTWIEGIDNDIAFKASMSLEMMSTQLVDACYALNMFETSRIAVISQLRNNDLAVASPMSRAIARRRPFIYAEAFVGDLEMLLKHIAALETLLVDPSGVIKARESFEASLPHLSHVRNSIQHADERAHGRARGNPIETQQVNELGISAPGTVECDKARRGGKKQQRQVAI